MSLEPRILSKKDYAGSLPVGFSKVDSELSHKLFRNVKEYEELHYECFDDLLSPTNIEVDKELDYFNLSDR